MDAFGVCAVIFWDGFGEFAETGTAEVQSGGVAV